MIFLRLGLGGRCLQPFFRRGAGDKKRARCPKQKGYLCRKGKFFGEGLTAGQQMLIILFGNVPSTAAGERKILWNCLSWTSPNGGCFKKHSLPCDKRRFGKPKNTGADRAHHAGDGLYPNYMARGLRWCAQHRGGYFILGQGMFTNPAISRRVAGILDTLSEERLRPAYCAGQQPP